MIIELIEASAKRFLINSIITNSDVKIETQLNNLTRIEDTPTMLISWDIVTDLVFDQNGFLENPSSPITALLMTKASTLEKKDMEEAAGRMGELFIHFIQDLHKSLMPYQKTNTPAITGASFTRLPVYGMGKHSGVLCKWVMKTGIEIEC